MTDFDVVILGAGGAGMMCALHAARRWRSVVLLDHSKKLGGKILISGGGRCNFTNLGASPANYVSNNPHFCKSALSRYQPEQFIQMVRDRGIPFHEKKLGQLFCDRSAQDIVDMLKSECDEAGAKFELECKIDRVEQIPSDDAAQAPYRFRLHTSKGVFRCESLVVATGGLSIPKIGATGLGYQIAEQFGLKLVERAPALDGFTFSDAQMRSFSALSGVSVDCIIECNGKSFRENILFTHSGLSGPAALQASLHWKLHDTVTIDLLPGRDVFQWFLKKKREGSRAIVRNLLSELLPSRFAEKLCEMHFSTELPLPQVSEKALESFCTLLHSWKIVPSGTVGYSKAEVTRGGVDTDELSSKTMESKKVPGLYFIGEVVDVTGWLGGYNFQWAWASGWAAAQAV
jgi:predicted Rossmann fold flavoprotein